MEILKGTTLSSREECARATATIRWVLAQAWRGACSSVQLTRDLLVLGMPRAHAAAVAGAAAACAPPHLSNGFMINKLVDASISRGLGDAVDTYKLTLFTDNVFNGKQKRNELLIDKSQTKSLLADLKKAYMKIKKIKNAQTI